MMMPGYDPERRAEEAPRAHPADVAMKAIGFIVFIGGTIFILMLTGAS